MSDNRRAWEWAPGMLTNIYGQRVLDAEGLAQSVDEAYARLMAVLDGAGWGHESERVVRAAWSECRRAESRFTGYLGSNVGKWPWWLSQRAREIRAGNPHAPYRRWLRRNGRVREEDARRKLKNSQISVEHSHNLLRECAIRFSVLRCTKVFDA